MSEQRQSNPDLCRRIAEARGYEVFEGEEECSGYTPGATWIGGVEIHVMRGLYMAKADAEEEEEIPLPSYDTDPAACLELMDSLTEKDWFHFVSFSPNACGSEDDDLYESVVYGYGNAHWSQFGETYMQAFARAYLAAVEANK